MSWSTLENRPKRRWRGSHLYRPIPDEIQEAINAVGHFNTEDGEHDYFVTIANWDKTHLYLKVTFWRFGALSEHRKSRPEAYYDSYLRHWFIIPWPIDNELAIDTTSE